MMIIRKLFFFAVCFGGWLLAAGAADTIVFATGNPFVGKAVTVTEEAEGTLFAVKPPFTLTGRTLFTVDPQATYVISGEFRAVGGEINKFYFGFQARTAAGQVITPGSVNPVAGAALSELAEPVEKGATSFKVKGVAGWKAPNPVTAVAFDVKEDYSDLPNFNLSPWLAKDGIRTLEDGNIELVLSKPMRQSFPAGTPVRLQAASSIAIYAGANGAKITGEWKTFSGRISGEKPFGVVNNRWRAGTAQAALFLYTADKPQNVTVEFRNLKVVRK